MLKKLQELLAQIRAAEKSAVAILATGEVGSRVEGTIQKLRLLASDVEERIRMLKEHLKSASDSPKSEAPDKPKAPGGGEDGKTPPAAT